MKFGFVSTRFSGTDGVTLEAGKWASVLEKKGHETYWMAGQLDERPNSHLVPEAFFQHVSNQRIHAALFCEDPNLGAVEELFERMVRTVESELSVFCDKYKIDVLIPQNALCLPMPVTLGYSLSRFISKNNFPTIAHHHDFFWERERYNTHPLGSGLADNFPPSTQSVEHVVINSAAGQDLLRRKGLSSVVVPNVFNFEEPPAPLDEYGARFRIAIGVSPEELLVLQPTRVIRRKGIEHAIVLLSRLSDLKPHLVISHAAGDEGMEYKRDLLRLATELRVKMSFVDDRIADERGVNAQGQELYTLQDAYQNADFITYPSLYEGFGNALIETFYFKKPVLVNRYSVFVQDIEPKDFDLVTMDGEIDENVVAKVRLVLSQPDKIRLMTEHNYAVAQRNYGFSALANLLEGSIERIKKNK